MGNSALMFSILGIAVSSVAITEGRDRRLSEVVRNIFMNEGGNKNNQELEVDAKMREGLTGFPDIVLSSIT